MFIDPPVVDIVDDEDVGATILKSFAPPPELMLIVAAFVALIVEPAPRVKVGV